MNTRMVKLSDGTMFDASKPLAPFDHAEWMKGLEFDLSSKRWGGNGWVPNPKGGESKDKDRVIRVHKPKRIKIKPDIKPAIAALCDNDDNGGRTLDDHRAMVEWYSQRYDKGLSPTTGDKIDDKEWLDGASKPRKDEPWRDTRHAAYTDAEGLALLGSAFKAMHEDSDTDD